MIAEHRLFFIYLLFCSSRFPIAQPSGNRNANIWNLIPGVTTLLFNGPSHEVNFDTVIYYFRPILEGNGNPPFFCGFSCNNDGTECFFGVFLGFYLNYSTGNFDTQLVWSANRDHPVKTNATMQLGQDGNLVLTDSDGTLVWSTNTTGKSVSGLILTDMGNLMLFDSTNSTIWQSFDHPTDCLLPGQSLVSGRKLIASASATNQSQGLFGLTILNGNWGTYINSDPPQFYYASSYQDNSTYFSFDGQTLTALQGPSTLPTQFMKLEHDGHLRVYQWRDDYWEEESDVLTGFTTNCGYPMVCGRYSICTNDNQCLCPVEGNLFRPFTERKPNLGCTELTPISCNSLHHSLIELKKTTYFTFHSNLLQLNSSIYLENTNLEECKRACLSNCSCKAVVWSGELLIKNCLLLNEVFSIMDNATDWYDYYNGTSFFLKVQENLPIKNSRHFTVIIGSTLAAFFGIALSIAACFVLFRKSTYESQKAGDFLDLEPILPGILTRFSYSELKIITQDFSRKLGEGGFGSIYEGILSNGNKIAVKRLNGLGQVKDSFLTEVKIVGSIHHVNLVKLIGFCAEKDHRVLIYEYMVNGSLDRCISHENQENGLTWLTRKRIISDIAKGLAYLHDECNQKIIHLDIKPHNILLDQNFNAKISDFGLSKLIEKDKSKVVTRMRGTPGYLAPEWLRSVITEKVDVYAFGIVLLEVLCGRKNLDWSQSDEDNVHLLSVFKRKAEQEQLMDMVDKNNEDMQLHREVVTEMMSLAAWCLQGDFNKRPSMSVVVKVLEGLVSVETNLDFNFTNLTEVGERNQPLEVPISSILPSVLSGPR